MMQYSANVACGNLNSHFQTITFCESLYLMPNIDNSKENCILFYNAYVGIEVNDLMVEV